MARTINNSFYNADGTAPQYLPGREPDNIKKRLVTLFAKLDDAYPDYVISGLHTDHKKWAETVTELYRALGYDSGDSFLAAYGYTVQRKRAGRTATVNPDEIIEELKKRYPNGADFKSLDVLFSYNPDLLGKKKTLANNAQQYWGMSFGDYLTQIGLLRPKASHAKILSEEQVLAELRIRYPGGTEFTAVTDLIKANPDLARSISKLGRVSLIEYGLIVQKEKQLVPLLLCQVRDLYERKEMYCKVPKKKPGYWENAYVSFSFSDGKQHYGSVVSEPNMFAPNELPCELHNIGTVHERKSLSGLCRAILDDEGVNAGTLINDLTNALLISDDGKTLLGFIPSQNAIDGVVVIPNGVEKIDDDVFAMVPISEIYINKELTCLGSKTLTDNSGLKTALPRIVISTENRAISKDVSFLYERTETGKKLCCSWQTNDECITVPDGVTEIAPYAFSQCHALKKLIIPDSVRHIGVAENNYFGIEFQISETNPNIFVDEDSIYEVCEDGSYRLISCRYTGRGRALILDGTSEISDYAFVNCTGMKTAYLPCSVRTIGSRAFANCNELTIANIPSGVTAVAYDVFWNCSKQLKVSEDWIDGHYSLSDSKGSGRVLTYYRNNSSHRKVRIQNDYELQEIFKRLYPKVQDLKHIRNYENNFVIYDKIHHQIKIRFTVSETDVFHEKNGKRAISADCTKLNPGDPLEIRRISWTTLWDTVLQRWEFRTMTGEYINSDLKLGIADISGNYLQDMAASASVFEVNKYTSTGALRAVPLVYVDIIIEPKNSNSAESIPEV